MLPFLNSILLLNQLNHVVVIATGINSCAYVYDSSMAPRSGYSNGNMPAVFSETLAKLAEFVAREKEMVGDDEAVGKASSLLSGSLSLALCCILQLIYFVLYNNYYFLTKLIGFEDGYIHTLFV